MKAVRIVCAVSVSLTQFNSSLTYSSFSNLSVADIFSSREGERGRKKRLKFRSKEEDEACSFSCRQYFIS